MRSATNRVVRWDDAGRAVLLERAENLLDAPGRSVLGIAGSPGAGKSTISEWLVNALGARHPGAVASLPMDGYHLAQSLLERRGAVPRKGAPETFDGFGYVEMVRQVRRVLDRPLYAPEFRRSVDDGIAAAIEIPVRARLVVTEGNYLLLDDDPWSALADLLDETWFVELDQDERVRRLTARHLEFDPDPVRARDRATGNDERNAALVAAGRTRSTLVVHHGAATE
jgi:pantothenate kinase